MILSTTAAELPMRSDELWSWQIYHRIKPNSLKKAISIETSSKSIGKKSVVFLPPPDKSKVAVGINKNLIRSDYANFCELKGISTQVSSSTNAGELQPSTQFPPHHCLINNCKMKPNLGLQYQVSIISLKHVIVLVVKNYEQYFLEVEDLYNLSKVNQLYGDMINNLLRLRSQDFSELKKPRFDYADQLSISPEQVDLISACCIHYGLHPGMLIRYLNGKYVGKSRDAGRILREVSPYISSEDAAHIKLVITQGCPSYLNFEEEPENKLAVIRKGNQHTFQEHPETVRKAMNKEERNSHVVPLLPWIVHFSPWMRAPPLGMRKKYGKFRVIFDSSTQTTPDKVILNHITTTDLEADINFGQEKIKIFVNIYNWRVSFPSEPIYLVLADITACFRFPRISADITGAFGFLADALYFLSTGHVFGSNTSASSWEPFRRVIQSIIPVYSQHRDLVEKHKDLLDLLKWDDRNTHQHKLVQVFGCKINQGIQNRLGEIKPLTTNIYVDDILGALAFKEYVIRLLAAIIKATFVVCGTPNVAVRQCPLSLEKWHKLIVGPRQIVLGLVVDTTKMTVGIMPEYLQQVRDLLSNWDSNKRFFNVGDMQKLVGKLARLGKGAPWIFKLVSHLYTSLGYTLKNNKKLLETCSQEFRDLINQIKRKQFFGRQSDLQRNVNFAIKKAAKMVNKHRHLYLVNGTMRDELNFLSKALELNSGIVSETPIGHLIPRMPTASIIGDSLLIACRGYSTTLKFWGHLSFPKEVVKQTLLHLKDNLNKMFISINCLRYVTIIVNYCASLVVFASRKINDDPHPVVLCVTDNTSALNWTLHTSKKLTIGRALARFFCGLLTNSDVGINAKWISTIENIVAVKISRLKEVFKNTNSNSTSSLPTYDYAHLQQEHKELKVCNFFHPSHKLLSLIWDIFLTQKCPDQNQILKLRPCNLGKLST